MLSDFGDHELVLSGLHENMLSQRYLDTHMERTCSLFNHLQAADSFVTAIGRNMDFGLMAYLPASLLAVRSIVAGPQRYSLSLAIHSILNSKEDSSSLHSPVSLFQA